MTEMDDHANVIQSLRTEVQTLRAAFNNARAEMVVFKNRVRDLAIETAKAEDWCTEGLNEALESLGLEPYVNKWAVEVRLIVEADSEEEAQEAARNAIQSYLVEDYDITATTPDED